jgi:hypothetical protein
MCETKNALAEKKHQLFESINHYDTSDVSKDNLLRAKLHSDACKALFTHIDQCPECQREPAE